jgi:hypothetical protein
MLVRKRSSKAKVHLHRERLRAQGLRMLVEPTYRNGHAGRARSARRCRPGDNIPAFK